MQIKSAIIIFALSLIILPVSAQETIYALNKTVTKKGINKNETINWGTSKWATEGSYVKIKQKSDGQFYFQIIIGGKFAYGHYFKYHSTHQGIYRYVRTDGQEIEYLDSKHKLSALALSNKHDEYCTVLLLNYRTSFGMKLNF